MLFRKRDATPKRVKAEPSEERTSASQKRVSTAETAHLIGPGCVKLEGDVPIWKPVEGGRLQLHPDYLRRVHCYGNVDFSTAVLHRFWKRRIHIVFLSPSGKSLLGKLQPGGKFPNLARLQHIAAEDRAFTLDFARNVVAAKFDACIDTARYYQRQGKSKSAKSVITTLKSLRSKAGSAPNIDRLRGIEGTAAAEWFAFLPEVIPAPWTFTKRTSRPPTDAVNALLSLGYSLATTRCEALLAAADLDPRVGFLHDRRSGRASLACDLVEPLRAPLVDRLVIGLLARNSITQECFVVREDVWRLEPDAFRQFLSAFENAFYKDTHDSSFMQLTMERIEQWSQQLRKFDAV